MHESCWNSLKTKTEMKHLLTILLISIAAAVTSAAQVTPREGYTVHVVKWYEDLNTISAKYGVPADIIIKVNNLKDGIVRARQELLIPDGSQEQMKQIEQLGAEQDDAVQEQEPGILPVQSPVSSIDICLLLPLSETDAAQNNNLNFYSGVLMAVRRAGEEKRLNIHLDVRDFSKVSSELNSLSSRNDFIIGPIRESDVKKVLDAVDSMTLVVSPLDQKASELCKTHRNLIQAPTGMEEQYNSIAASVSRSSANRTVVVCDKADSVSLEMAVNALKKEMVSDIMYCNCGVQGDIADIEKAVVGEAPINVILAVSNEAVINNAVRNIGIIAARREGIRVYGTSRVSGSKLIPVENIHKAEINVYCPFYIDYSDPETLSFIHRYRALFNSEPSQYAFQGYDIASFMINTYAKYGKGWREMIAGEAECRMLQTSFKLQDCGTNGGLINTAVRKTTYTGDYKILF